MVGIVLGVLWGVWALVVSGSRPGPVRRPVDEPGTSRRAVARSKRAGLDWSGSRWTSLVGSALRIRLGFAPDGAADRCVGEALVVGGLGWAIVDVWGIALGPAWWLIARRGRLRVSDAFDRRVLAQLPDVAALLAMGAESGRTIQGSINRLAEHLDGPVSDVLAEIARPVPGTSFADRLESEGSRLGRRGRPLVALLLSGERHGAPTIDGLHRLAGEARADHRRRLEEDAHRMPVRLLGPLVFGILPAFFLLTVVPLVGSAAIGVGG